MASSSINCRRDDELDPRIMRGARVCTRSEKEEEDDMMVVCRVERGFRTATADGNREMAKYFKCIDQGN